jgi:hypothetical protein
MSVKSQKKTFPNLANPERLKGRLMLRERSAIIYCVDAEE